VYRVRGAVNPKYRALEEYKGRKPEQGFIAGLIAKFTKAAAKVDVSFRLGAMHLLAADTQFMNRWKDELELIPVEEKDYQVEISTSSGFAPELGGAWILTDGTQKAMVFAKARLILPMEKEAFKNKPGVVITEEHSWMYSLIKVTLEDDTTVTLIDSEGDVALEADDAPEIVVNTSSSTPKTTPHEPIIIDAEAKTSTEKHSSDRGSKVSKQS